MKSMISESKRAGANRRSISSIFTREEIDALTERSDLMGFAALGFCWSVVALSFVAMAWATKQSAAVAIPVFLTAMMVIAGRQLGMAILMHDAAHRSLFKTRWLNDTFVDWVCARPLWNDLAKYRVHHLVHHFKTGQAEDPDLSLSAPFPATRASLVRKFIRDVSGLTGLKFFCGRFLMDAGFVKWTVANDIVWLPKGKQTMWSRLTLFVRNITPMVVVNCLLFTLLSTTGHPGLYLFWILAYMTPFSLFVRIRSIAEHACTENSTDTFRNTRTTRAGLLARATVAPFHVNYHIEHHVMAAVPYFRLPIVHRLLRERGMADEPPGYIGVLENVTAKKAR